MYIALWKKSIPWTMAVTRAVLGPIMIAGQTRGWNGGILATLILTALLSDIFDGILAHRWHCDTPAIRLFDSMADTVFYLGVAIALWIRQPQLLHDHALLFSGLLALETARFALDFAKFGKPASYHSYLAKTWGSVLATAVVDAFLGQHGGPLIGVALLLGIVCDAEGLTMSIVLPQWHKDVKTLRAALRLRRDDLRTSKAPSDYLAPASHFGGAPADNEAFTAALCSTRQA
jgi:phosphatidylglycerophosphate synthase